MRRLLDFIREHEARIMTTGARLLGFACFGLAVHFLFVLCRELGWI